VESMVQVPDRVRDRVAAVDLAAFRAYLVMDGTVRYLGAVVLPAEMVKGVPLGAYLVLLGADLE
jgi:hypothetical protein